MASELMLVAALNRISRSLIKEQPDQALAYLMSPGLERLRQQIAGRLSSVGVPAVADDVIIAAGALEAIHLCIRMLTRPGDTLLMESPTYYCLLQIVEECGLSVVELPNDPVHGIDPDDVRRAIQQHRISAALLVQNFSNPMGSLMSDDATREVVTMLNAVGIPLIEDDLYGDLGFTSVASRRSRLSIRVIACCMRIVQQDAVARLARGLGVEPSPPEGIESSRMHDVLCNGVTAAVDCQPPSGNRRVRATPAQPARRDRTLGDAYLQCRVASFLRAPAWRATQDGFVLWIELPKQIDAMEMFHREAQKGIAISPGILYSADGRYHHHIRLNCAVSWTPVLEQALRTLGKLAAALS